MDSKSQLHTLTILTLGKKAFMVISYEAVWALKIDAEKAVFNIVKLDDILPLLISPFIVRLQLNSVQELCT
jgi:hypothetical protein